MEPLDLHPWLESARYWLAAFLAIALPPAMAWWFVVHPLAPRLRRLGKRTAFALVFTLFLAAIAALFPFRDLLLGQDLGFRPVLAVVGLVLLAVSTLIHNARKKHLTTKILMGLPEMSDDPADSKLLDEGIYAKLRHPRYVEFVLGFAAWALILDYVGLYWIAGAIVPVIHLIVLLEERELRDRFGEEYVDYARRVPRYWPRWNV